MSRVHTLLVALLLAGQAFAADAPFSDLDFDAATAKATEAGKLLLVDFTATWCPPCKMMEKQTWPDPKVIDWVTAHAVAIQVDIDKHQDLAQKFGIQAIPTVVFLKDGKELDRHTGFRSAADFVPWGDAVLAGKSETSDGAADAKTLLQSDDVDKRLEAARGAMMRGENEVALQHFLWLWPNTRKTPKYGGVLSFMLSEMAQLAQQYPPAREAFTALVDDAQKKVEAAPVPDMLAWREWTRLCDAFELQPRVAAWYEARRDEQGRLFGGDPGPKAEGLVIGDVFDALLKAGRPRDAARLYPDVRDRSKLDVQQYKAMAGMLDMMPEEMRAEMRQMQDDELREGLAKLHAAALIDGRADQAAGVAADLLATLDDAPSRVALVTQVLDLGAAHPAALSVWLDEAAAKGGDVAELRARLAAPGDAPR
ncbi:MAG TPA: thioredoxin family protein [Planctomycetota bacterium]|nr:thioredoxin family protein [Planctomycetota bacterium]